MRAHHNAYCVQIAHWVHTMSIAQRAQRPLLGAKKHKKCDLIGVSAKKQSLKKWCTYKMKLHSISTNGTTQDTSALHILPVTSNQHHLMIASLSTYPCRSVSGSFIVSDWRLLSHLLSLFYTNLLPLCERQHFIFSNFQGVSKQPTQSENQSKSSELHYNLQTHLNYTEAVTMRW